VRYAPAAIIVLVGIIIYSNSFDCSFHFDDFHYFVENEALHSATDPGAVWKFVSPRFIGNLTLAANYQLHGERVFGYHAVNLIIHILAALAVRWFVRLLLSTPVLARKRISAHKEVIASGCALVFLAHPIQTQAVTYIVQRLASLAALFYIVSMACYMKGRLSHGGRGIVFFSLSLLAAILAMLTKEHTATLPVAVLLLELYFFRSGADPVARLLRNRKSYVFLAGAGLALLVVPVTAIHYYGPMFRWVTSHRQGDPLLTPWVYLLTQFRVIPLYIRLLFFPAGQSIDHDIPAATGFLTPPGTLIGFVFLISLLALAVWLFRKHRLASFGIVFFFLTLSVESSIQPLHNVAFEHRIYLPSLGFVLVIVPLIYTILYNRGNMSGYFLLSVIVAVLSLMTFQRNTVWKTEYSLWSDASRKSPDKARPFNNLGLALFRMGRVDEAIAEYGKALELAPGYYDALNNLGNALLEKGDVDEAVSLYKRILSRNPGYIGAYVNYGATLIKNGRPDDAVTLLKQAVEVDPSFMHSYFNLGVALDALGDSRAAADAYTSALKLDPDNDEVLNNLGTSLFRLGEYLRTIEAYERALAGNPENFEVCNNLGNVYDFLERYDEAVEAFGHALELNPNYFDARFNLGNVRMHQERYAEAVMNYRMAMNIRPYHPGARINCALGLYRLGKYDEALAVLDQARTNDPDNPELASMIEMIERERSRE